MELTTNIDFEKKCTVSKIYVDYKNITKVVGPGSQIYIDDGLIMLIVSKIGKHSSILVIRTIIAFKTTIAFEVLPNVVEF